MSVKCIMTDGVSAFGTKHERLQIWLRQQKREHKVLFLIQFIHLDKTQNIRRDKPEAFAERVDGVLTKAKSFAGRLYLERNSSRRVHRYGHSF